MSDLVQPTTLPARDSGKKRPTPAEITAAVNPSTKRRIVTTLAFPLLILLAVPYWWYVTSIVRLPLPIERIEALSKSTPPLARTKILFSADRDSYPQPQYEEIRINHVEVLENLKNGAERSIDSLMQQKRPRGNRIWDLDPWTKRLDKGKHHLRMHLKTSERANESFPLEPYIQTPDKGFMTSGIDPGTLVIPVNPKQVGIPWLKDHYKLAMTHSLMGLVPSEPPEIPLRAIKYQPNITLSFVLLNEDSAEGGYVRSWDIREAISEHIQPHLDPLRDIFNFTIESQVLYHAPLSFDPAHGQLPGFASNSADQKRLDQALEEAGHGNHDAEGVAKVMIEEEKQQQGWMIDEEMMKVFVNTERWSLDSGSTNNPVLRFLLFVPSVHHRPMHLVVEDSADSFLLPQYGSVALLNPPTNDASSTYHLSLENLNPSFHLFTQHLYSLLALPHLPKIDYLHPCPAASPLNAPSDLIPPFSSWQVDQVLRQRARENSEEARKTLTGIVRLVSKIKEMKLEKAVRDTVLGAVERLEKMDKSKDPKEQFILSRDAVGLANKAFFDPSMMGLLYFPDEHKFAVYTPLFAPVAVPIVLGIIKEFLAWRRRRRARLAPQPEPEPVEVQALGSQRLIPAVKAEAEATPQFSEGSVAELDTPNPEGVLESLEDAPPARSLRSRRKVVL